MDKYARLHGKSNRTKLNTNTITEIKCWHHSQVTIGSNQFVFSEIKSELNMRFKPLQVQKLLGNFSR